MFQRQAASDLLWGMSHRKAFAHVVPQVRLARQLEAAIPLPPTLGQSMSSDRIVATRPGSARLGVASQFPADCRYVPFEGARNRLHGFTGRTEPINLDPLIEAELAITLSHRHNT